MLDNVSPDQMPDNETLIEMYRKMTMIRLNGERFATLLRTGRIAAPYYSARGQEVIPAAMAMAVNKDDYLVTIYRGMHDQLAKGIPLRELWAEFAGRETGSCKGKGGPMHITHPETGIMVTTGIVGSGMPIANGLALASQEKGDGKVTWCSFGDGASNIGAFHEAMNMASLWKLPVIFVCQNNQYAEHTSYRVGTSVDSIATRAISYSMHGECVDGNEPVAMLKAAEEAVARARAGEGPTLLEAVTFRFEGHVYGDPGKYIPEEEYNEWLAKEPYPAYKKALVEKGHAIEEHLAAIDQEITAEIDDAIDFALNSPYADIAEIGRDVYVEDIEP